MAKLFLTSRALDDIQGIYDYSVKEWGEKTAASYLQAFEAAFTILKENKNLLRVNSNISSRFKTYAIMKHYLICDVIDDSIIVLTIKHVSMNLLERLKKLEPNLDDEAKILYNRLVKKNQSDKS